MTNLEIYNIANKLLEAFSDEEQKFPVKLNFFLQKNKKLLVTLAQEIEESRINIAKKYGQLNENGSFIIGPENTESAQGELNALFNIEQNVDIMKINYNELDPNMELTSAQMEALMFMIE